MAAKRKTPATRTKTVYRTRAAPRKKRRSNPSGVKDIPAAMLTVGVVAANAAPIRTAISNMSIAGLKQAANEAIQPEQLKKTAANAIGWTVAGYAVQKFAPKLVKKPLGMIAKKIKAVF
jgi:hypothetical protein